MRITDPMLIGNMTYNLNQSLNRMEMLQFQSTGKRFRVPSDDPIGTSKSLRLRTDLSKVGQYKRNVDDARSWMKETESAIDEINEILQRTNELVNQAANETYSEDDLVKIKEEIKELKGSVIKVSNSTYSGRTIFTGYKTESKLLDENGNYVVDLRDKYSVNIKDGVDADGKDKFKEVVTVKNESGKYVNVTDGAEIAEDDIISTEKYDGVFEYKIGQEESVNVNTVGNLVFGVSKKNVEGRTEADYVNKPNKGEKAYLVQLFDEIEESLDTRDTERLQQALTDVKDARGNILAVTAQIGAKSNRMKITKEKLEDQNINLTDLLSEVEDANIPEVYMQLQLEKNVYNASLSIGAQILQPSLADFIR